jgi:hypothetical protein
MRKRHKLMAMKSKCSEAGSKKSATQNEQSCVEVFFAKQGQLMEKIEKGMRKVYEEKLNLKDEEICNLRREVESLKESLKESQKELQKAN